MSSDGVQTDRRGPGLLAWAPWIVIAAGIVIMVVLFVVAVVALTGDGASDPSAEPPVRPAAVPMPTDPSQPFDEPTESASASPSATTSASPSATSPSPSPSASASAAARRSVLTGTYQVYDGANSFVGQLRIRNSSDGSRSWTATLTFPAEAGDLRTYWVDGGAKPTMTQSGNRYVFTGTVGAEGSVSLNLQFRRSDGSGQPLECTVSGTACARA